MLTIELVCIGGLKQKYLREGCAEYQKMISPYARIEITELPETRLTGSHPEDIARVVAGESAAIARHIQGRKGLVVALCVEGERYSSAGLAGLVAQTMLKESRIIFVMGGSHGFSRELSASADLRLSMSDLTFPHQLARLMLLEQLYRALNLNAGGKYHK